MLRPISPDEAAIVERALRVASIGTVASELFESIPGLAVTAPCGCGCATVWFGPGGTSTTGTIIADARAQLDGQEISVIVWLTDGAISGLEFVTYSEGDSGLPPLESVRSWG